jgi:elongation factor Ts
MSTISAAAVKTLRDRTNAPMMECKSALAEASGDMEKAVEILRKKSKGVVDKRVANTTAEGRIGVHVDPAQQVGAIVEVLCESAPVAKSDPFVQLTTDLARHVALKGGGSTEAILASPLADNPKKTVKERIDDVIGLIRENMRLGRVTQLKGLLGHYVHHDGSVGVLLACEGKQADPQLLRDVCMHITAKCPLAARAEDIDPAVLEKEKEIARSQIAADPKNASKPANILEKIAEGKIKTWLAENVLLEQPFVKDDSKTVGQLLAAAGLKLNRYVRYRVGEGS